MAIVALCRRLIAGSGFFPRSSGGTLCSVMQLVVLGVVLLLALSAPLICGSASGGMGRPPRASRTSFRCLLGSGRAVFLDPLVSLMVRMGLESLRSGSSAVSLVLFTVTLLSSIMLVLLLFSCLMALLCCLYCLYYPFVPTPATGQLCKNKRCNLLIWDPSSPKDGPKTKPGTSETHRGPRGNVPVAYVPGTSIWGSVRVLEAAHFRAKK